MGMRFCANCGASISVRIPEGDNFARHVCDACGTVFYQNPRVVVGCIPEWGERILLCRRAIEPRYGFWTFPAGYLENGETIQHAAARETLEEASARVQIESIFAVLNLPAYHQVHIMFRGRPLDLDYATGSESLEWHCFDARRFHGTNSHSRLFARHWNTTIQIEQDRILISIS